MLGGAELQIGASVGVSVFPATPRSPPRCTAAGYSSLGRLLDLPVDVIKVDRSLLAGVPERPEALAVLTAIQRLAEACDCDVVAEGVETPAQRAALEGVGCRLAQGFGLARPMPADGVTSTWPTSSAATAVARSSRSHSKPSRRASPGRARVAGSAASSPCGG